MGERSVLRIVGWHTFFFLLVIIASFNGCGGGGLDDDYKGEKYADIKTKHYYVNNQNEYMQYLLRLGSRKSFFEVVQTMSLSQAKVELHERKKNYSKLENILTLNHMRLSYRQMKTCHSK